jgi:hypothetical protein
MQEDNKEEFKRERINGWNHACSRLHDWFGIFIVSSDMVPIRFSRMAHRHVGSYGTITVIAAVSYGELMPKSMETRFLYGWSFAVIQTGTIAAVGVALLSLRHLFQLLVIKYLV